MKDCYGKCEYCAWNKSAGCNPAGRNQKELTRIITVEITQICKSTGKGIDMIHESAEESAKYYADDIKKYLYADDVHIVAIQDFINDDC